jgi:heat shock protein HslJ
MTIGPLATTRMACEQGIMDEEQAYLAALGGTTSYGIVGKVLTLTDEGGARMVEYTAP